MANSVTFIKGQGGLGRPLPGTDYISGLLFYSGATLPTGFSANDRVKIVNSLEEAEDLGITDASLGETASTATYLVTNAGTAGNTFEMTCAIVGESGLETVTLCDFTSVSADVVSASTMATRIASEINLGTPTHGFTASAATATVTITAAPGQGVFLNTGTPYTVTIVGTIAGTLTQNVVPGVASDIDIMHYHVKEFFRAQPKGKLYIGIYALADIGTFSNVIDMQNFAQGEIKQIGIYQKNTAFATAHVTTLQSVYNTLDALFKPVQIIYNADIYNVVTVTTLSNLRLLSAPNVSVTVGQDGNAKGFKLWKATGRSIGCVGVTLGAVAFGKVSDNIAWVGKFNMSSTELDVLNFANGQVLTSLADATIDGLDNYGYVFLKKHIGIAGSYFNDNHTCVAKTNDYAYIAEGRTMDKAIRNLRAILLPSLASPIFVNADGTLTEDLIGYFETLCQQALDVMSRDKEISAYNVIIDPTQNVLSTSELEITVEIVPVGSARTIKVNVGFKVAVTS